MDPLSTIGSSQGYAPSQQVTAAVQNSGNQTPRTGTGNDGASDKRQAMTLPEDRVNLSGQRPTDSQQVQPAAAKDPTANETKPGERTTPDGKSLEDPQVKQVVAKLKQTEEKVKAHEAAHKAAGGNLASSASYSYTQGPDGRSYITGGEVQIDMSPGRTPQETISRMQQVIRAALAPADPSGQDRAVAAQAASQMAQAQQQKLQTESPTATSEPGKTKDQTQPTERQTMPPETAAQARQAYGAPSVRGSNVSGSPAANLFPTQTSDGATALSGISSYA